jgi:hypothetical protein
LLDQDKEEPSALLEEMKGGARKRRKSGGRDRDDDAHEAFYERMQLTHEFESLLEALYADFSALRLSAAWDRTVVPLMRAWARGVPLELEVYAALRQRGNAHDSAAQPVELAGA